MKNYDITALGELLIDLKKCLISPNEDFVTMVPLGSNDKTRVIGQDEGVQKVTDAKRADHGGKRSGRADAAGEDAGTGG